MRAVFTVVLGLFGGATACYSPAIPEGAACTAEGDCPSGQSCLDGVCRRQGASEIDGGDDCSSGIAFLYQPSNIDICQLPVDPPALALTAATTTIDTSDATLGGSPTGEIVSQLGGGEVLVVATRSFSLAEGSTLDVVGERPLVIIALEGVDIDGTITAAADLDVAGPGQGSCGTGAGVAGGKAIAAGGWGGGSGGGFAGDGGSGGGSDVVGGVTNGEELLAPLRGGCPGGVGGGGRGGTGGAGGGAIQISSVGALRVGTTGVINVAGGGGRGGGEPGMDAISGSGGGGGGSGGGVLLEGGLGVTLEVGAVITAAGGGGGGGAVDEDPGASGGNGSVTAGGVGGAGAVAGADLGGDGGSGGGAGELAGVAGAASVEGGAALLRGGGGGGGAAGRIVLRSGTIDVQGTTIPAALESALAER